MDSPTSRSGHSDELARATQAIRDCLEALNLAQGAEQSALIAMLQQEVRQRQATLMAMLDTDQGKDSNWLQFQLDLTQQLTAEATKHLLAQRAALGSYRKGRKQAQQYQNIKAGK